MRSHSSSVRRARAALLCLCLSACTSRAPVLPTGTPVPFPDYRQAWSDATRECAGVHTLTASLALSGKVGRTKMRGRIDAGFAEPSSVRLEGVAPFGRPVFVLVATGERGTLVLTRDNRVLRDAPPRGIVNALVGVPFDAADLRSLVAGCGLPQTSPPESAGRYPDGWVMVQFPGGSTYLQQVDGRWQIVAAAEPHITVHYERDRDGRPSAIRVTVSRDDEIDSSALVADLTLRPSEVDVNVTLDPKTFTAEIPPGAEPITLAELRRAGPLGGPGK